MVKIKNQFSFSPTVLAAFIIAFLLYTNIITVANRNSFLSIIPMHTINSLKATIISNPSKTNSGNFYSVQLEVFSVESETVTSQAKGRVQLLIPAEIVEALYPGKLYSKVYQTAGNQLPIIEQGLQIGANGYFMTNSIDESQYPVFISNIIKEIGWENNLSKLRAFFRLEFKRLLYAWNDAGGLLLALLSGSREYTNTDLAEGFRNAGISHILALSGMHLSLFAGIALAGGKFFGGKKIGTLFSLVAVILFVWFAGLSPSLLRALLCTLIALILQFCSLPGVSGNAEIIFRFISPSFVSIRLIRILSLSFLIHICFFPQDIFTAAFMLSYGALVGIALAEYLIKPWIVRILPSSLASSLSAAIGAQLCTTPVSISLFGTLVPIGIISSVVVSPIALLFLVFGMFGIVISFIIPFLLYPIGDIIQLVYWVLEWIVLWFSQFPPVQF